MMRVLREQRLENRLGKVIPLQIQCEGRSNVPGETVNVSSRGLSCRIPIHVSPYSRLTIDMEMAFRLRGLVTLQVEALVVRSEKSRADHHQGDEYDLGLFFLNLDREKAGIIDAFLKEVEAEDTPAPVTLIHQQDKSRRVGCIHSEFNTQGFLQDSQLTRLEKSACLGEMSSVLAHEIKNPLAGLAGSLQILGEEIKGIYPSDELFSELLGQIERIDNTVEHLLRFSTTESPRKKMIQAEDVINDTLSLLGDTIREKNIKVTLCHGVDQPSVSADERLLRQAFLNIFADLVEGIESSGWIAVNTCWADKLPACEKAACTCFSRDEREGLNIVVMTSGSRRGDGRDRSMPPSPAERKKRSLNQSMTQQIIEQHNGSVFVQSSQGESSLLLVVLPL